MSNNKNNISKIRRIVDEYGSFSTADVQAETSPVVSSAGNSMQLAERFGETVTVKTYQDGEETDENEVEYESLEANVIEEILRIAESYHTDCEKAWKRSQD